MLLFPSPGEKKAGEGKNVTDSSLHSSPLPFLEKEVQTTNGGDKDAF